MSIKVKTIKGTDTVGFDRTVNEYLAVGYRPMHLGAEEVSGKLVFYAMLHLSED